MMADDLEFFDLNLNRLLILPSYSNGEGYTSMNAKQELVGNGSFEINLKSKTTDDLICAYREGLIIKWREFWGYMTAFCIKQSETRIFGTSLNGLLHRIAVPPRPEDTTTIEYFAQKALFGRVPWLGYDTAVELNDQKTFGTDGYTLADDYLKKLFDGTGCGYEVTVINNSLVYRHIRSTQSGLVIAEDLKNACDIEISFNNAGTASVGWYYDEKRAEWKKYPDIDLADIGTVETVLNAKNLTDARTEFATKKAQSQTSAQTRGIRYLADYKLGDIVRLNYGSGAVQKQVTAVEMWQESEYAEQPILTDWSDNNE